uniref:hypothetical protein n=1 Tax=Haemophilus parahaemolyticus TaxID=735 RepID=UPI0015F13707|nr:hypothetical protein [Haemophilus parahaemolyticus]
MNDDDRCRTNPPDVKGTPEGYALPRGKVGTVNRSFLTLGHHHHSSKNNRFLVGYQSMAYTPHIC